MKKGEGLGGVVEEIPPWEKIWTLEEGVRARVGEGVMKTEGGGSMKGTVGTQGAGPLTRQYRQWQKCIN